MIHSCLANGQPKAAEFLVNHGAPLDLMDAAGLGRLDILHRYFGDNDASQPVVNRRLFESAYFCACCCGQREAVEFFLTCAEK